MNRLLDCTFETPRTSPRIGVDVSRIRLLQEVETYANTPQSWVSPFAHLALASIYFIAL